MPKMGGEELVQIFIEEATDLLNVISEVISLWQQDLNNKNYLKDIKRDLHTLKGGARMLDLPEISELAHELESLCEGIEKDLIPMSKDIFDVIYAASDRLSNLIEELRSKKPLTSSNDLINQIKTLLNQGIAEPSAEGAEAKGAEAKGGSKPEEAHAQALQSEYVRVRASLLEKLNNLSVESSITRVNLSHQIANISQNLSDFKYELKLLQDQLKQLEFEVSEEMETDSHFPYSEEAPKRTAQRKEKWDTFYQMLRDLKETSADLVHMIKSLSDVRSTAESIMLHQARVGSELQNRLMDARLVPFESIVPRLSRIARQVAQELGKKIEFRVLRVEGEMDRNVLEQLIPALEHILRNSIDHGIESAEARKAKNKSEEGHVSISFSRVGSEVVIEVADDGGGMNTEAIKEKAIHLGMLPADTEASEEEILRCILQPGFSTRDEVTQISGRGVGMDVVNGVVKELSGNLTLVSQKDVGTKIMIRLPFTSSLNRILLFKTFEQTYGMLLSSIEGVVWVNHEKTTELLSKRKPTFTHAHKPYYFHYLGHLLGYENAPVKSPKKAFPVLMLQISDYPMALLVDELLYSREVVIKSLGPQFKLVDEFSGASILSDASVILILDSFSLSIKAKLKETRERTEEGEAPREKARIQEMPLVMVVDDSITIRTVVKNLLERNHYRVIVAKDGIDALQRISKQIPDLILLDIEMPRMDGFEFLTTIRQDENLKQLPVIMVTAFPSDKNRQKSEELGAKHFLAKPYQDSDLLRYIEEDLNVKV